jgi:DNA (cytosine-5)-methyltransferase 1
VKVLNLYSSLGGNRYKWDEVTNVDVTAVEIDQELASLYKERFPNDKVIVADAHQYLLDHYKEFEFIWSSPPCPTHSRVRHGQKNKKFYIPKYPDMRLYQEVIFLQTHFLGKYVVENVIPYYDPLILGQKRGRHIYWCNFILPKDLGEREIEMCAGKNEIKKLCEFHDFDFYRYKGKQRKDKIGRNLVDYEAGKTILKTAIGIIEKKETTQIQLFQ